MAEQPMTLIEKLRNPAWVHGPDLNSDAVLDKEQTLKDMREAADELERLKPKKRPVAFGVAVHDGWIILQSEEAANIEAEFRGVPVQGLYVRDGT